MHKSIFLTFFLALFVFRLHAQNDFRNMNWGESPQTLFEKYPPLQKVQIHSHRPTGYFIFTGYRYTDNVAGLETDVYFVFYNDELVGGYYNFTPHRSSYNAKLFIEDFDNVSAILQRKYEMKRDDTWHVNNDAIVELDMDIHLRRRNVEFKEIGYNDSTRISHVLENIEGNIQHTLMYATGLYAEKPNKSIEDDF